MIFETSGIVSLKLSLIEKKKQLPYKKLKKNQYKQIKTTLRLHLTPVKMATIKNTTTNVGKDAGGKEPSYTVGGNVN
jgi:hypothetical protein